MQGKHSFEKDIPRKAKNFQKYLLDNFMMKAGNMFKQFLVINQLF